MNLTILLVVAGFAAFFTYVARLGFDARRDHRGDRDELTRNGYQDPFSHVNRTMR